MAKLLASVVLAFACLVAVVHCEHENNTKPAQSNPIPPNLPVSPSWLFGQNGQNQGQNGRPSNQNSFFPSMQDYTRNNNNNQRPTLPFNDQFQQFTNNLPFNQQQRPGQQNQLNLDQFANNIPQQFRPLLNNLQQAINRLIQNFISRLQGGQANQGGHGGN